MPELLKLNYEGLENYITWAEGVIERLQDLTPVFVFAHTMFILEMDEQFRSQGAYLNGVEWVPASPGWINFKKRVAPPPPPFFTLYYTSRLYLSLTAEGHAEHVFEMSPTSVTMGTMVPYAETHQKGLGDHPQRRIIRVTDAFKSTLFDAFMAYVLKGVAIDQEVPKGTPSE